MRAGATLVVAPRCLCVGVRIGLGVHPFWIAFLILGLIASVWIAAGPMVTGAARRAPGNLRTMYGAGAVAASLLCVALAVWTAVAFMQSTTEFRTKDRPQLEHVTSIGYAVRAAPNVAPTDGMLEPVSAETLRQHEPAPLYSNLVSKMDFGFNYEMRSEQPLQVLGYGGAGLRIKAEDGWERTIALQDAQFLSGPKVTLWFTMDMDMVRVIIAGVELTTGSTSDWYDLTVIPVVRLAGDVGGEHIDETYMREFTTRMDPVRLAPGADLEHTQRKIARTSVEAERQVPVGPLSVDFSIARWLALAALALMVASDLKLPRRQEEPASAPGG
ncbi:MAG: hypothetical protein HY873_05270 [Chloroflexi bacterium]|nr:hypothetical protein [Chloroflexota bacterium]